MELFKLIKHEEKLNYEILIFFYLARPQDNIDIRLLRFN